MISWLIAHREFIAGLVFGLTYGWWALQRECRRRDEIDRLIDAPIEVEQADGTVLRLAPNEWGEWTWTERRPDE